MRVSSGGVALGVASSGPGRRGAVWSRPARPGASALSIVVRRASIPRLTAVIHSRSAPALFPSSTSSCRVARTSQAAAASWRASSSARSAQATAAATEGRVSGNRRSTAARRAAARSGSAASASARAVRAWGAKRVIQDSASSEEIDASRRRTASWTPSAAREGSQEPRGMNGEPSPPGRTTRTAAPGSDPCSAPCQASNAVRRSPARSPAGASREAIQVSSPAATCSSTARTVGRVVRAPRGRSGKSWAPRAGASSRARCGVSMGAP